MIRIIYGVVLFLVGALLAAGGVELLSLGGSAYYALVGIALLLTAVLTVRAHPHAARLYAVLLCATVLWAFWECGADLWGLLPRTGLLFVLGLGLLLPSVRRKNPLSGGRKGAMRLLAGLVLAVGIGGALHAFTYRAADPLYQAGTQTPSTGSDVDIGTSSHSNGDTDWPNFGNDQGNNRFSPLAQINSTNVQKLQIAWEYHVGPGPKGHGLEVTPLKVGDAVYLCTSYSDVIALDAETGREKWRWRAKADTSSTSHGVCRGVAYYKVPDATGTCAERILSSTIDARLVALDAHTGELCPAFGDHGVTSLATGMGEHRRGFYLPTSAPTLVHGKVVIGGNVLDNQFVGEPPGVIRAFDAVTGKFAWAFDVAHPHDHGEPPAGGTYTQSTPNSWAPMGGDEKLGLVYVPTGNATPDWYGAQRRPFDEKYASSVIALDADTGEERWSFQTAHHDLWDYDVSSPPTVIDLSTANGPVRALVQPTKRGEMFVLDAVTGKPLSPVTEKAVPQQGHAPGERLSPTQPFSDAMPSFRGAELSERDMWGMTPFDQLWCRIKFKAARYAGPATPPGLTPSIVWPGALGGSDWGGVSIYRNRGLMMVNSNRVPMYVHLIPRKDLPASVQPTAVNEGEGGVHPMEGTPYGLSFVPFLSPMGIPCSEPPYSRLTAVDLTTKKVVWSNPLGTARDLKILGIPSMLPIPMGVPTIGGSLSTRGGLVFIGAVPEKTFRAFDAETGEQLWSARLPSAAISGPMSYWSEKSQRQFVVVAAGGNIVVGAEPGDSIVAYALPQSAAKKH